MRPIELEKVSAGMDGSEPSLEDKERRLGSGRGSSASSISGDGGGASRRNDEVPSIAALSEFLQSTKDERNEKQRLVAEADIRQND